MLNSHNTIVKNIVRALLVLLSAVLIVVFFPHERTVSYDYTVGKPWKYGQLIAEFDFPVYKSEQVVQAEKDSALHHFQPYYKLDQSVAEVQLKNLSRDLQSGTLKELPKEYKNYIYSEISKVYESGIMDSHDYTTVVDSGYSAIRVEKGKNAVVRPIKKIYTAQAAYVNILTLADSTRFNREVFKRAKLNNYLSTNLIYDEKKTEGQYTDVLNSISYFRGYIQQGEKIIDRGDIVTSQTANIIESLTKAALNRDQKHSNMFMQVGGTFLIVLAFLAAFLIYLYLYRKDYLQDLRSVCLLYFLMTIFPIAISLISQNNIQHVYYVPITTVAIFVSVFMDSRTAFFADLITIIISSLAIQEPYLFVLTQLFAGLIAIFSLKQLASRSQLIRSVFIITALTEIIMLCTEFRQGHTFEMLDTNWYIFVSVSGVLLLCTYPFLFLVEKLFGFTSPITLIELSNVGHPLLHELSKEAPGTFNHSIQVANIASEIASKIGGDALLVRTAALYHDVGKIKNPTYFTENQSGTNPHDNLPEERSAQIIIQHVNDGLELAEKYGLPRTIKEFIMTHHGLSKTTYFYIKYRNQHPDEEIDEAMFCYPGPNPFTKEQAILMIADSVEAASKSLKVIDDASIKTLVDNIVDAKMTEGYFKECPITFRDIQQVKEVLVSSLKTIYHTRISYPTLQTKEEKAAGAKSDKRRKKFFYRNKR